VRDLVDEIFNLWENIGIKILRVKKAKPLICSTSLEINNLPEDMTITHWKYLSKDHGGSLSQRDEPYNRISFHHTHERLQQKYFVSKTGVTILHKKNMIPK
jgi:hypothetical protein